MTKIRLRQTIHRGSVLASGLAIDTRLVSETTARRRILELSSTVLRLFRVETQLLVIFRQPIRTACVEAMGAPLVRQGRLLSSAPLDADEHAALQSALDAVVLVEGGKTTPRILDELVEEDISSWIDLSPFLALSEIHSLGAVVFEPKAALTELKTDIRQSLGVTPLAGEAHQAIQSLTQTGSSNNAQVNARSAIQSIADVAGSILTGLWRSINTFLRRPRYGNPGASPVPALAEVKEAAVQSESWFSKVRNALWRLAARALLRSRLASLVGRRHAEYLARVLEMFDSNQLDDALRHAIPLNSEVESALRPPSFRTPSPRTSLAIVPGRAGASTSLGVGEDLFEGLRQRYRRAFDRLAARGEIEKAAFVLAELLNSNEEAVSFLEKHNRLRLAAEIAEARKLPPGLTIRLWFLAKDRARAIRIARRTGAFADAVVRLEKTHQHEAHALRLLWADTLASSGAYAAAVDAVWPVTDARNLALRWLDNAIEVGGVTGARMLARKARLLPAAFPEIRASVLGLLQDQGVHLPVLQALAKALSAGEATPETRILAKATARRLLGHSGNPDIDRLVQRLLDVSGDTALRADARASRLTKDPKHQRWSRISMHAFARTHQGVHHTVNKDTSAISFLDAGAATKKQGAIDGNPATKGMVLAVFDGASSWSPEGGAMASQLAATTVVERLRAEFSTSGAEPGQWARALAISLEQANRQLFEAAAHQPERRGMTSATVATVCHGKLFIAQLGITRGYVLRGQTLVQVTRDHSLLNEYMGADAQMNEEKIAAFTCKTVTRMIGAAEKAAADISQVELEHGDVVLLCSDGLWSLVEEERIRGALVEHRNPRGACNALLSMALEAGLPDDISMVVAKFEGMGLPRTEKTVVSSPFVPPTIDGKDTGNATPLASRPVALEISRSAADSGAMKVFDAAELPDGRMLVALGEVGVFLLSREGSVLTRFAEPANRLVISDHGDRALLMAPRGEAYRVARLDLMAKRVRHWCDARFHQFAADFDGLTWFIAHGGTVYAIDAAADGWEHQWKVGERGATVGAIQRDSQRACIWFEYAETNGQIWTFELPSLTLRQRRTIENGHARFDLGAIAAGGSFVGWRTDTENPSAHAFVHSVWRDLTLTSIGLPEAPFATDDWMVVPVVRPEGMSLHLFDSSACRERARIDLEGAGRDIGVRFQGDHLTVFDGRGRVLVISLGSGEVIREHRIS